MQFDTFYSFVLSMKKSLYVWLNYTNIYIYLFEILTLYIKDSMCKFCNHVHKFYWNCSSSQFFSWYYWKEIISLWIWKWSYNLENGEIQIDVTKVKSCINYSILGNLHVFIFRDWLMPYIDTNTDCTPIKNGKFKTISNHKLSVLLLKILVK